jgi:hypothetical protein
MRLKRNFDNSGTYLDNTDFEEFLLYHFFYPVVNFLGINRPFNLLRHKLGYYNEFQDGRCMWCGVKHRALTSSDKTK